MSIITILFHIVPAQYRYKHEFHFIIFHSVFDLYSAYKRTGKVPKASTLILDGSPQNTLLLTTTIVNLLYAMTTYFDATASAVMIGICILFYIYSATTCFNSGTYLDYIHQVLVLGGSILGLALCAANLYIDFAPHPWGPYFFVGFLVVACIIFILTAIYLRFKEKRELALLDALEETEGIMILKGKNKFKQVLTTGFKYAHPVCNIQNIQVGH